MATDDEYKRSYGDLNVHRTMLTDGPRMRAYYSSIVGAKDYFKDATVLDVGAGTGILSVWVAKHTKAKIVYAVEANEEMAGLARRLALSNGVSDRIAIVNGKVEEVDLPVDEVDIIISEWMGHYLLHESMLDSVLFARDKWLRKGASEPVSLQMWQKRGCAGLMFPCKATIFGEIGYISQMDMLDWADQDILFGCDISEIFEENQVSSGEPILRNVWKRPEWSVSCVVKELDLMSVTRDELNVIESIAHVVFENSGVANCVILSFTCEFPISGIILDTRPGQPKTHWKQTVVPLGGAFPINKNMRLDYMITISRQSISDRAYDINFEVMD